MKFAGNTMLLVLGGLMAASASHAFAQQNDETGASDSRAMESPETAGDVEPNAGRGAHGMMRGHEGRGSGMMRRLDSDGSGDISPEEFGERRMGWLTGADSDGDGVLSMEEMTAAIEQRRQERREARLLRRFDIDGDGRVTVEELERHQEKLFALKDRDDDGVLSSDEMGRDSMHGRMHGRRHGGWHHGDHGGHRRGGPDRW